MIKNKIQVIGRVIDTRNQSGVKGFLVEVWDKDLIFDDLVGSAFTDEQGDFRVEFDESYFKEVFSDRRPDLFFRVFKDGEFIKSTENSVLWNVKADGTEIIIEVDAVRPRFQQAPSKNASLVGTQVYSHSGEYSPRVTDVEIPGRGLSLKFVRKYRSALPDKKGPLGRGWTFSYAKRIERVGSEILYHDGLGRSYRFSATSTEGEYIAPTGFYAALQAEKDKFLLKQRNGSVFEFELLEDGGRLLTIRDRNDNQIKFDYTETQLRVTDTFGRDTIIEIDQDRVKTVQDHSGRIWKYHYNEQGCLIEIVQPATQEYPVGLSIKYEYDEAYRLVAIIDPKGQNFLRNVYDDRGRVVQQKHGDGTFEFQYESIGQTEAGLPIYRTTVRKKNGARLVLDHNASGQVERRSLFVAASSLPVEEGGALEESEVALVTLSKFNRHGEIIRRVLPEGNSTEMVYDEDNENPLQRGNLIKVTQKPSTEVDSEQTHLTTQYTYEPDFQRRRSITNPRGHTITFEYDNRGNLTRKTYPEVTVQKLDTDPTRRQHETRQLVEQFEYNNAGQLLRVIDARGGVTEYHYYPAQDPSGAQGKEGIQSNPHSAGGYLSRIVQDPDATERQLPGQAANLVTTFGYDERGNITTTWDGKGNPTHITYNTHNRAIAATSREPFKHEVHIRYDANQNPVESDLTFERNVLNNEEQVVLQITGLKQRFDYNLLNNVVRRTTVAEDRALVETFERDASENIIRKIQPMGNIAEYRFDERNLLLERRTAVGTNEETTATYTYTRNGRRHSRTNGRGETIRYYYDGFHHYRGFTNPGGTSKKQWFDAAGNVTRIEVTGDPGLINKQGEPIQTEPITLLESWYQYDELNRRVRIDRAWRDQETGGPLGNSQWDEEPGLVSTVVEYADNHRPAKVWYETGNILNYSYDGANRVVEMHDETGETISVKFDENGNPVFIEQFGPEVEGAERFEQITFQTFDELDRLVERSVNYEPPETLTYNALGLVTSYTNRANSQVNYLHDGFGRQIGRLSEAMTPDLGDGQATTQQLVSWVELDENSRVVARTDAAGRRTSFEYDALNRRTTVFYPDGASKHFEYDSHGNVARIVDQNGNEISQSFDALNRLVERAIEPANGDTPQVEQYHFDGLNRLVAAVANGINITRRYDSLSRMLEETQLNRTIQYGYDAPGNRTQILYPGGQEIHKRFDMLKRVIEVTDGSNDLITGYTYRSSGQFKQQRLGNNLEADFAYNACQSCLSEVVYRSNGDDMIIDGSRYRFDAAGNRIQEAQLHQGENVGERYIYDTTNRLVGVQYGVEALNDPESSFEQEVVYDLDAVGTWRQKTTRDSNGQIVAQLDGETNKRHAYTLLGNRHFEYDANGNRVFETRREKNEVWTERRYIYDYANRPVTLEYLDANGSVIKTIEYGWDAFSRQIFKRITDASGSRETMRVWNGRQLIEEWEDNELVKSFVYGAHVEQPVAMNRYAPNGTDAFFYTRNGRGLVTGLVNESGQVAERYRFDVFGEPVLSEVNGQAVDPEEQISSSPLGNLFFSGGIWDPDAGLSFGLGNGYDPEAGQFTNPEAGSGEPGCGNIQSGSGIIPGNLAMDLADMFRGVGGTVLTLGGIVVGAGAGTGNPVLFVIGMGVAGVGGGMIIGAEIGDYILEERRKEREAQREEQNPSSGGSCGGGADSQAMYTANEGVGDVAPPPPGGDPDDGGDDGGGEEPTPTPPDDGDDDGGNDGDDGEEGESGSGCGGGGASGVSGLSPTDDGGANSPGLRSPGREGGGSSRSPGYDLNADLDSLLGGSCGDNSPSVAGVKQNQGSQSSKPGCSGQITAPSHPDQRGNSYRGPNRVNPSNNTGLGCGNPLADFVGGTNPLVVNPEILVINPVPVANFGAMISAGGLGMRLVGMPGMGYTEPQPEGLGRGGDPLGSPGGHPGDPYGPVSRNSEYLNPGPEQSGGSCGTGTGSSSLTKDCSSF